MASLSIPERYQAGVSKIRDLDMTTVVALKEILDQVGQGSPSAEAVAAGALPESAASEHTRRRKNS